jgi:hypothetical protein
MQNQFAELFKNDRRKQWKLLKEKHKAPIAAAKINFDQKLGPVLDGYQAAVDKLTKLAAEKELSSDHIDPVRKAAAPLKSIIASYANTIKTLPDPAKKELAALLTAIGNDVKSWDAAAIATTGGQPHTISKDQEKNAVMLVNLVDAEIRPGCLMLVQRGPKAKAEYIKLNKAPAVELTDDLIESARLAGSASHQLADLAAKSLDGKNYAIFQQRAKATEALLKNLKDAAQAFHTAGKNKIEGGPGRADGIDGMALTERCKTLIEKTTETIGLLQKV